MIGQFSAYVVKGVLAGVIAQGITLLVSGVVTAAFVAPPTAVILGVFAISAFVIGGIVSDLDEEHHITQPMTKAVEGLFDES
ncbi:hypothetical protein [Salinivibrio sp. SS2]|uniref:hypothetical protein n=1 Tax=Salinivibrio sp. SS2 TaxID=1892894 RepID=UPI00084BD508|nr:hypothetical protein [Salinivibrio sp. DV]ODP96921.1 hypothetical protein BGK46_01440 [Salinivibrio sp. DV]